MKITIEGTRICLSGSFRHHTHTLMARRIEAAGGLVASSLSGNTDLLAHGDGYNAKLADARTRGVPIIDAAQLEALIAGEAIEVADLDAAGEVDLGDALGEARAILDGAITSQTWSDVVSLVDACDPERLPALVDFLEPQIDRWQVPRHARWRPDTSLASLEDAPDTWLRTMPYGTLRVAPFRWVVEMNTRRYSPKHRLARAVSTAGMKMSAAALKRILSNPHLTNLRTLELRGCSVGPKIWALLRTSPATRQLEHLGVSLGPRSGEGIDGEHHLDALRSLALRDASGVGAGEYLDLFTSSWASGVRELVLCRNTHADALTALGDASVLPELERVVLDGIYQQSLSRVLGRIAFGRVEEATVRASIAPVSQKRQGLIRAVSAFLTSLTPPRSYGPTTLDLSEVTLTDLAAREGWELEPALYAATRTWASADTLRRLRLGPHDSPRMREATRAMGLEPT
jgi:hypothetical protein